jgi:hypothetical protein
MPGEEAGIVCRIANNGSQTATRPLKTVTGVVEQGISLLAVCYNHNLKSIAPA